MRCLHVPSQNETTQLANVRAERGAGDRQEIPHVFLRAKAWPKGVQPGPIGRQEMHVPSSKGVQPLADLLRTFSGLLRPSQAFSGPSQALLRPFSGLLRTFSGPSQAFSDLLRTFSGPSQTFSGPSAPYMRVITRSGTRKTQEYRAKQVPIWLHSPTQPIAMEGIETAP
eukprot:CAMPEP_0119354068 /NCGR_PEP_ID=MMETSP1334-20130426/3148_1 /TAXON_ID=127549 /ORGANISM="Calcidiscus leptoporus, Strain RCC1130" /LENGTH=168 /DNA_ID=CAMNT_0007367533 /DNA_START=675 /DNA_END=1177 /DNA_ORIENTATION=-